MAQWTPAEINELAERCEALSDSGSRDIEFDIQHMLGFGGSCSEPARYTRSLDAAMKLVPEKWTAWGIWSRQRKTRFYAVISRLRDDFEDDELDEEEDVRSRRCVTPALALCAAGLRAHAASVDTHPKGGDAKQGSVHG